MKQSTVQRFIFLVLDNLNDNIWPSGQLKSMVIYILLNTEAMIKILNEINCFLIIIYILIQFRKLLVIPLEISTSN